MHISCAALLRNVSITLARCHYLRESVQPGHSAAIENISISSRLAVQRCLYVDIDAGGHLSVEIHGFNNGTAATTTYYCLKDGLSCLNFQEKSEMKFTSTHFLIYRAHSSAKT